MFPRLCEGKTLPLGFSITHMAGGSWSDEAFWKAKANHMPALLREVQTLVMLLIFSCPSASQRVPSTRGARAGEAALRELTQAPLSLKGRPGQ